MARTSPSRSIRPEKSNRLRMRGSIVAICALLFLSWAGRADAQSLVVAGVVRDQAGAAVPDVTVRLVKGGDTQTQLTKFDGSFAFDKVTSGTYELLVERDGFKPSSVRVVVGSRSPRSTPITLE